MRYGSIAFAVAAAGAALSPYLLATMAVLMLAGAGWVLTLSTFNVAVQMSAPRWVVARALSMYQMSAFGGLAAGSWLWGNVAASQGVKEALLIAAVVLLGSALFGLLAAAGAIAKNSISIRCDSGTHPPRQCPFSRAPVRSWSPSSTSSGRKT